MLTDDSKAILGHKKSKARNLTKIIQDPNKIVEAKSRRIS